MAIRKAQGDQFFDKSEEAEIKRLAALGNLRKNYSRIFRNRLFLKLDPLIKNNNHRPNAAKSLNIEAL